MDTNNFSFTELVTLDGVSDAEVCGPDGCTPVSEKQAKEDGDEEENIM
ncbi:hypothetical protein [Corynebacterium sp.]